MLLWYLRNDSDWEHIRVNFPAAHVSGVTESIRVRGLVQGVGFRPTVWKLAKQFDLTGEVLNDGDGVRILLQGDQARLDIFVAALPEHCPPLARIDAIERSEMVSAGEWSDFRIAESTASDIHTGIVADATVCKACLSDILDPNNRRFNYPFTNCTHCGPRFSITRNIPYDRANTSMNSFQQCPDCLQEYQNPADRRFHAQPNACPVCGPKLWLENSTGQLTSAKDTLEKAADFIRQGKIIAIKGVGGFHLACEATNNQVVRLLRQRKQRYAKPLALMAANTQQICRYCYVSSQEQDALSSTASPIVILQKKSSEGMAGKAVDIAAAVAPDENHLGFMLPYSPLHHLLMAKLDYPIVMTSGNISDEPQCIDNADAKQRLAEIADYFLLHDRDILNRIDDSVVREMSGKVRVLRRGRGLTPQSLPLPEGFDNSPDVLALGGELKNTFCCLKDGQAIVSQHMGDLEDARTLQDYQHNIDLYQQLFDHNPELLAIDAHPEYLSSKAGELAAGKDALSLFRIQHHHAHIASCLGDNLWSHDAGKVIGIALDGLGYGDEDSFWGGEILLADYQDYERIGHFRAFPLFGGTKAIQEPWRNAYAHLSACFDWASLAEKYQNLPIIEFLQQQPLKTFDAMLTKAVNAPMASSCGRLFDAVAATVGLCVEQVNYEGQAAIELESQVDHAALKNLIPYTFDTEQNIINPTPMWSELLEDCSRGLSVSTIATKFHSGLARAICSSAEKLCNSHQIKHVALSGGVFQNKTLLELCVSILEASGLSVLLHQQMPANDGGISFGQALIAAAKYKHERSPVCV